MNHWIRACIAASILTGALFCTTAGAEQPVAESQLRGDVVGVSDGDTLTVLVDKRQVRVRLAYVDAPERGQAFGQKAKQALADLCIRQRAIVTPVVHDVYGRLVARVQCADMDAAEAMVRDGFAWVFTKYAPLDAPLYVVEAEARSARRGLWIDANPKPPWKFREPFARERLRYQDGAASAPTDPVESSASDAACPKGIGARLADGTCPSWDDVVTDLLPPPRRDLKPDKGCGSRGGPGYRNSSGRCAGWDDW